MSYRRKSNAGKAVAAIALSILMLGGGLAVGLGWGTNWKYDNIIKNEKPAEDDKPAGNDTPADPVQEGNTVVGDLKAEGMQLNMAAVNGNEFAALGISDAESAFELTANVDKPAASNKRVEYSLAWVDNTGWAQGKDVADYVTLNKTQATSGEAVVVACMQPFGAQIKLTATALGSADQSVKAEKTIDYMKKVTGVTLEIEDKTDNRTVATFGADYEPITLSEEIMPSGHLYGVNVDVQYSAGTIEESYITRAISYGYKRYDGEEQTFKRSSQYASADEEGNWSIGYSSRRSGVWDMIKDVCEELNKSDEELCTELYEEYTNDVAGFYFGVNIVTESWKYYTVEYAVKFNPEGCCEILVTGISFDSDAPIIF